MLIAEKEKLDTKQSEQLGLITKLKQIPIKKMIFNFKQFTVDQTGCTMKINTDGVLLGALAETNNPTNILDIGTGTGVIALMLAQRFTGAKIHAVEINTPSADTARANFKNSPFGDRMLIYPTSIAEYFKDRPDLKYDLIVSNPPFYLNSLEASTDKANIAKHTDEDFFKNLINGIAQHLHENCTCWMILPLPAQELVKRLAIGNGLALQRIITIHSFKNSEAHREIISLGFSQTGFELQKFVIYDQPKVYSQQYVNALKDFFMIF